MQPLKSFKPCCLKWYFCWILTPVGLCREFKILRLVWTIRYVYKDLIWRAELSLCRFLSASYCCRWLQNYFFPGCSLIRIVSSTTPGSGSLVHGFTHDKSVPCLFSTCLDFFFGCSSEDIVRVFNMNAHKPKFYSSTVVYFTLADLLGNQ